MAYYRANFGAIAGEIVGDPKVAKFLSDEFKYRVETAVDIAQERMLEVFDSHPANLELKSGAIGRSDFIQGRGDLFSFIGFPVGVNPVGELRKVFEKRIKVKIKKYFKNGDIQFEVYYPNPAAIIAASQMPWATGLSWAEGMEEGIPGISQYLAVSGFGRSQGGVQLHGETEMAKSFISSPYLGLFFATFSNSLKSIDIGSL